METLRTFFAAWLSVIIIGFIILIGFHFGRYYHKIESFAYQQLKE